MNILVTGSNGQLGKEIQTIREAHANRKNQYFFTDIDELDITDYKRLEQFVKDHSISTLINCAAYTNVDKAEEEQEKAFLINDQAVDNLVNISLKHDIILIHISTDYVFNGESFRPYKETDPVNPESIYGKSKLAGEQKIIEKRAGIIIRTSWLYSSFGKNFVKTIERLAREKEELKVVFDQVGSPTYARDLAKSILKIINHSPSSAQYGIYHFSNEGVCSWYDLAKEIADKQQINCEIHPIESKDFPTPAKRPHYSVLNKTKIKKVFKQTIPHWKESLHQMLDSTK